MTTLLIVDTPYGRAVKGDAGYVLVTGYGGHLQRWATRPDCAWPCSSLARCAQVDATFDRFGGLVDLEQWDEDGERVDVDIPAGELDAWTTDALRLAGFGSHPACR